LFFTPAPVVKQPAAEGEIDGEREGVRLDVVAAVEAGLLLLVAVALRLAAAVLLLVENDVDDSLGNTVTEDVEAAVLLVVGKLVGEDVLDSVPLALLVLEDVGVLVSLCVALGLGVLL
jgi:hypothetical protein